MTEDRKLYPIIGNGERLIEPTTKGFGGGEPTFPRSYIEARDLIKNNILDLKQKIEHIPIEKRMDDIVITLRLNSKFLAKSYTPTVLFREAEIENVGSRKWLYLDDNGVYNYSKMHFVKVSDQLSKFDQILDRRGLQLSEAFKMDVQKIEQLSLLDPKEIIVGFPDDWKSGKVEMVLHPFENETTEVIEKFRHLLLKNGVDEKSVKVASYPGGATFISSTVDREILQKIYDFNPLRTVHPLKINFFPGMRDLGKLSSPPLPAAYAAHSIIKVGMFDGGVDCSNPLLSQYVKENRVIDTSPIEEGIAHGNGVAGAILYGPLNDYQDEEQVKQPLVSVESFRVLPLNDPCDIDLYEAIDIIEQVVPSRDDISIYNLSFGPSGAILDDDISRFTFSLDQLAWNYRKLFVVAVGNDGELVEPFNRIQAPSDLVNGLGVGAFTFNYKTGDRIRASYSCIGQGREGCKVKPDLLAFGGDNNCPIQLVSLDHNSRFMSAGTSFASPIVAGKAGNILAKCERFNPLVARGLLIHGAKNPGLADNEIGYGLLDQSVDDMLLCTDNHVTIVFASSIQPTKYAKLPIPIPTTLTGTGTVQLDWTIACLSKVNSLHVEDYTQSAIEDSFHPDDQKFRFSKDKNQNVKHLVRDMDKVTALLSEGWIQSALPVSRSANSYQTEQARRGELKWDTVVKRSDRLRADSLSNPFLVLHGMGRQGNNDRIDYAVILTISAPKYLGNLYQDILTQFRALEPIRLRAESEILVLV